MRQNLEPSLKLMFGDEGGYSNRKTDSGGPTKFGVTHKTLASHRGVGSVTAEQVKKLTIKEATDIYVESYWPPSGGDVLPTGLDYAAFDFGVNSGPMTAVKKLQEVLKVPADGWIGPATRAAVDKYPGGVTQLIADYCARRMAYLQSLRKPGQGFKENGRGWTIRVTGIDPKGEWPNSAGVIGNALAMAQAKKGQIATMISKAPDPLPAGGDSKATPQKDNPLLKPEVLLSGVAAVGTGGGAVLTSGLDPIRVALAIGIIVIIGLVAYFAFLRIQKTVAS